MLVRRFAVHFLPSRSSFHDFIFLLPFWPFWEIASPTCTSRLDAQGAFSESITQNQKDHNSKLIIRICSSCLSLRCSTVKGPLSVYHTEGLPGTLQRNFRIGRKLRVDNPLLLALAFVFTRCRAPLIASQIPRDYQIAAVMISKL